LHVLLDFLPLVVCVSGTSFDAPELKAMSDGFEVVWTHNKPYAVLFVPHPNVKVPGPQERSALAAFANHPRVVDISKRFCVGTAAVVPNPLLRVALSAVVSSQPMHQRVEPVSTVERDLEHCMKLLETGKVPLDRPAGLIEYEARARIQSLF
jgi:hypothetical protein